ncbi:MAG: Uma2 family endonuclease [Bryobacteraceae bacterium]|jgi:Uma2 family endonuclease
MTAEEYLELNRVAERRSEFVDGAMILREGANIRHATVQVNVIGEVGRFHRGSSCELFGSDLRVRVSPRMYTCSDLTVVCGKTMFADERRDSLLNPTAIFEVLSPSTEYYDRGVKLRRYREIESLMDYVLVAQDQVNIEHYTRSGENTWTLRDYRRAEDVLMIASIGVSVPLAAIYERIEFAPE